MSEKVSGIYAKDGRPFDYPLAEVDAKRWQRRGELSIEQAAFVVAGFEPPPIEVIRYKPIRYQERPGETWARPSQYEDFVLEAESALQRNQMAARSDIQKMYTVRLVELPTILRWARERPFKVSSVWEKFEQDVQLATTAQAVPVVDTTNTETTPAPIAQTEAAQVVEPRPSAGPIETPKERRARWLVMFEKMGGANTRGALAALSRELNVDRSNLKKDLNKAEEHREEKRREGALGVAANQLVLSGKRHT